MSLASAKPTVYRLFDTKRKVYEIVKYAPNTTGIYATRRAALSAYNYHFGGGIKYKDQTRYEIHEITYETDTLNKV